MNNENISPISPSHIPFSKEEEKKAPPLKGILKKVSELKENDLKSAPLSIRGKVSESNDPSKAKTMAQGNKHLSKDEKKQLLQKG